MTRKPETVNSRLESVSCPASNFHKKAVSLVARTISSVEESWTSDLQSGHVCPDKETKDFSCEHAAEVVHCISCQLLD